MRPARILYVDHAKAMGGAQMSLLDVLARLDRTRFEPVLLHARGAELAEKARAVGVKLCEAPLSGPIFEVRRETLRLGPFSALGNAARSVGPVAEILGAIRRVNPDLIHSNSLKTHVLAGLAARLTGRCIVWHVRDLLEPGPARRLLHLAASLTRPHVIAISRAVMHTFDDCPGPSRTLVHNGIDLAVWQPREDRAVVRASIGVPDEALVVIVVGRLTPWKGHKTLIEAFSRLPNGLGDVRLLIVGECVFWERSFRDDLERLAKDLGVAGCTVFTGNRDDVPDLLAASDLFCLPSRNEPFGRVVIEAMAQGLPVVATNGGGVPEIVEDKRTGLLVTTDSVSEMSDALAELLADRPRREAMGRAGLARVREHFDIAGTVAEIQSVYEGLLQARTREAKTGPPATRRSNPALKRLDSWTGSVALGGLSLAERLRRRPTREIDPQIVRRVLIIKLCCMGDGLLAVPAIRATARHFPNAAIICLCTSRNYDVFDGLPYFDEIVTLGVSGTGGLRELLTSGAPELLRLIQRLRRQRLDLVIDLDLYFKATAAIAYLTGAPVRAGFDTEDTGRGGLYTHRASRQRHRHEVECFLDVVARLGVPRVEDHLEFSIDPASERAADDALAAQGIGADTFFAVLVPGSSRNWPEKQWPSDRFAAVADALSDEYGLRIVLVGAPFERELCKRVAAAMTAPAENLAGTTSIKQTGHILRRSALTVSNDTGPMHLSAAVGTPVVGIFGPTDDRKWRPWGDEHVVVANRPECGPCYYLSQMPVCEHARCLRELPVEAVLAACRRVLGDLSGSAT